VIHGSLRCWRALAPSLAANAGGLQIIGVELPHFLDALREAPLEEVFIIYDAVRRASRLPRRWSPTGRIRLE
jgi:hypothetical protein